jgi:hypothetical protein
LEKGHLEDREGDWKVILKIYLGEVGYDDERRMELVQDRV